MDAYFQLLSKKELFLLNAFLLDIGQLTDISGFCNYFLRLIKKIIPYDNAHFIFFDRENSIVPLSFRINICEKTNNQYIQYYNKIDDFFARSFNTFGPKRSTDIMNYREWQNTEYFIDFHKKNHYHYVLILDIHYKDQLISTLSLSRERKSVDFTDKELIYLKLMEPHIANHLQKLIIIKNLKNKKISEVINNSIRLYHFSNREIDIINCVLKGYSNAEIADLLFISTETVKKHLNNVYKKCDTKNRMDLMATLLDI